jgi:hypothetical protein
LFLQLFRIGRGPFLQLPTGLTQQKREFQGQGLRFMSNFGEQNPSSSNTGGKYKQVVFKLER